MSYAKSPTVPAMGVAAPVAAARCANHTTANADWRCAGCGQHWCEACIARKAVGSSVFTQCPNCGSEPVSLAASKVRPSFYQKLTGAIAYPIKGWGALLIFFGAVMLSASAFAAQWSLRAIPVALAAQGYYFTYLMLVMNKTGDGDPEMPNWPSVTVGLIGNFFMMLGTLLITFVPVILYAVAMFFLDLPFKFLIFPLYMSLFFLPMAMLRVSMFQTIEGLNPFATIRSIFQIPTAYMTACMIFFFMIYVNIAMAGLFSMVPIVGGFLGTFFSLYLALVEAHILGLLYYAYQERFDWFGDI